MFNDRMSWPAAENNARRRARFRVVMQAAKDQTPVVTKDVQESMKIKDPQIAKVHETIIAKEVLDLPRDVRRR